MKALLLLLSGLVAFTPIRDAFAQSVAAGVVTFSNVGAPPDGLIYAPSPITPGQGVLAGAGYQIALYWAPLGSPEFGFMQIGAPASLFNGLFFGGGRTIFHGSVNGPVLDFHARAWCTDGGRIHSYEEARAFGVAHGTGPIFSLKTKDPTNPLELAPSVDDAPGWQGFVIGMPLGGPGEICVPEPSTIALGILGAGALLLLRRRK